MKIAILTWLYNGNYGTLLQAYALQSFLKREGYDVSNINYKPSAIEKAKNLIKCHNSFSLFKETSVYKGYKQDKIEMRGDRAEMSDFPLYLNTVAGGLDRRDQTIGGFSFVVKIYAVPVIEIIG